MTSIVFLIETTYCNSSDAIISERKKYFANFFVHYGNLDSSCNIFKTKDDPDSWYVSELTDFGKYG